ncbi:AAA family ATPase [Micromonospora sp. NPDC002296]|uniref:AAA family ATPase n=1 Tax=Micromonospora sp. NPDC002296 TaxID=3154271 RepID=UPI00332E5570
MTQDPFADLLASIPRPAKAEPGARSVPAPTEFEFRLSEQIDLAYGKGSGTVWRDVQKVLGPHLGLTPEVVGAISVTEDGVKNNRPLSAGLITAPRQFLLIVVDAKVGLPKQRQAVKQLIPLTRHMTTVGLAEKVDDVWRVRQIIDVEGVGIGRHVKKYFPLVSEVETVPLVPMGAPAAIPLAEVELPVEPDSTAFDPDDDLPLEVSGGIAGLTKRLMKKLAERFLCFTDAEQLVSQCVLALVQGHLVLHGPPGTAKTTLARLLVEEFGCSEQLETATADWSTYDVIGGFRPGTGQDQHEILTVHRGCVTEAVLVCQKTVQENAADRTAQQAHWLILDEMNRAEIDKAIGPLYTVLGGGVRTLKLWFADETLPANLYVPRRFRIIATMNDVDTAYANEISQGLSRRFTFVYIGIPGREQTHQEIAAVTAQGIEWLAREHAGLLAGTGTAIDEASSLAARSDVQTSILRLEELLRWIRYGELSLVAGPSSADDLATADEEAVTTANAAAVTWPLGTAQALDVVRQLLLAATAYDNIALRLDEAVSDLIVPQLAHAPRPLLSAISDGLAGAGTWPKSRRSVERLLNPLALQS